MPRSSMLMAVAALAGAAFALPAAAQFAKPEDAIKYRKAAFTVMATHFGRVAAMAQGKIPFDAKAAADNAEIAAYMSKLPYAGFIEGTDKGETRAEPKIWTEMDKFKAAATKMQDEMAKLNVAAKSGNLDAIKAAAARPARAARRVTTVIARSSEKARIFLLRDPIPGMRCSPYGRTAAVLGLTSGRSLRNVHTF